MSTQRVAEPFPGTKLYQQRAEIAFPILVRQAEAGTQTTYKELGEEIGVRPRNLNFILGNIGRALLKLERQWGEPISRIQTIVVNSTTRQRGRGGKWFAAGDNNESLKPQELGSRSIRRKKMYSATKVGERFSAILAFRRPQSQTKNWKQLREAGAVAEREWITRG